MTNAFCRRIEQSKYYCLLYTNVDYINLYFGDLAGGRYDLWLAAWPNKVDVSKPPRKCGIWQWGGSVVPGINGSVDTNEAYHDYAEIISQHGLNGLTRPSAAEKPAENWKTTAAEWVKEKGIADGSRPDDPATRAEVWIMLKRQYELQENDGR